MYRIVYLGWYCLQEILRLFRKQKSTICSVFRNVRYCFLYKEAALWSLTDKNVSLYIKNERLHKKNNKGTCMMKFAVLFDDRTSRETPRISLKKAHVQVFRQMQRHRYERRRESFGHWNKSWTTINLRRKLQEIERFLWNSSVHCSRRSERCICP